MLVPVACNQSWILKLTFHIKVIYAIIMSTYSNPPIYWAPIYHVHRFNVPLCVPLPYIMFYNKTCVNFPPIYRAPDLPWISAFPRKYAISRDDCILISVSCPYISILADITSTYSPNNSKAYRCSPENSKVKICSPYNLGQTFALESRRSSKLPYCVFNPPSSPPFWKISYVLLEFSHISLTLRPKFEILTTLTPLFSGEETVVITEVSRFHLRIPLGEML